MGTSCKFCDELNKADIEGSGVCLHESLKMYLAGHNRFAQIGRLSNAYTITYIRKKP